MLVGVLIALSYLPWRNSDPFLILNPTISYTLDAIFFRENEKFNWVSQSVRDGGHAVLRKGRRKEEEDGRWKNATIIQSQKNNINLIYHPFNLLIKSSSSFFFFVN